MRSKLNVFLSMLLCSCGPGIADHVDNIAGDYFFVSTNAHNRSIELLGYNPSIVVSAKVESYKHYNGYIIARQNKLIKSAMTGMMLSGKKSYWIIDVSSGHVWKELTLNDCEEVVKQRQIKFSCNEIDNWFP